MQIFLSHATADRTMVAQVKAAVGTVATVYCTEDDVQAGVNVHTKIQERIRKSEFVIVLLTSRSADRIYLHQEIGLAKEAGKLIIPLVGNDVPASKLGLLEGTEYIQIDEPNSDWMPRLSRRVQGLVRDRVATDVALGIVLVVAGILLLSES
jgi:hypothetical protein